MYNFFNLRRQEAVVAKNVCRQEVKQEKWDYISWSNREGSVNFTDLSNIDDQRFKRIIQKSYQQNPKKRVLKDGRDFNIENFS